MLITHLKISLRNLLRYKSFSVINILGLTLGLTSFLAISLYVIDEFSFDRYHENKDRIYRAVIAADFDGQINKWAQVPNHVVPTALQEIPEVETAARYFHHNFGDLAFLSSQERTFTETELYYADPELFKIFSIEFLNGNKTSALSRPGTVVLSERATKKYFGNADPMGKVITIDNNLELEVTGIYKDFPPNSSLQANLIASFASNWFGNPKSLSWGNASFESYFLLQQGTEKQIVDKKIQQMLESHIEEANRWYNISLQPLLDMHLRSGDLNAAFDQSKTGDINQVKILIGLALVILVIAAVNYMNLATAQSQRRSKEVGISKTLGATVNQLSLKFYFEAALFISMAVVLSLGVFTAVLPAYNILTAKQITLNFITTPWFWFGLLTTVTILTLLAGSYPAWYLSFFSPKAALQQKTGAGNQVFVRKSLVVLQFSMSMILIVSSIVFYRQMNYIRDKNLGYEPEQVIAVMTSAIRDKNSIQSLKNEFESLAGVKRVARSQSYPGIGTSGYTIRLEKDATDGASIATTRATHEVLDVLGINLLAGKSLPENKNPNDTTIQVVLNKSAAEYLGYAPDEAIGRLAYIFNNAPAEIVGVADDFHFTSLHQKIGPYCFNNNTDNSYTYLLVKVDATNITEIVQSLETTYKKIVPAAFEYTFIDDRMAELYNAEQKLATVVLTATSIAIFLACLGLYALAAFTAEQRIKEIGIRKVMGASVHQLVSLLSTDFLKLILIAVGIGMPVGYYFMNEWLSGFAYKTTLSISIFVLSGFISILIATLTISYESIKAAISNPVNSLRNE